MVFRNHVLLLFVTLIWQFSCSQPTNPTSNINNTEMIEENASKPMDIAVFGGGCFWCVESVYLQLQGVVKVESGYSGGDVKNPTYREVCYGKTGHAEVIRILYNAQEITYKDLLQAFFLSHDPTTLNRQGNDIGTQYRSVIFYSNKEQQEEAVSLINKLDKSGAFSNKIVTEVLPLGEFYVAEDYHQNYYNLNKDEPYCQFVIRPKLEKFEKIFKEKLKRKTGD